jgi:hypothetical protein
MPVNPHAAAEDEEEELDEERHPHDPFGASHVWPAGHVPPQL